ncbi:MAG: BrnA antitoxin family protein [Afipia sp.]|nr:BrnA antitoxin family protein [Afipia sp.]
MPKKKTAKPYSAADMKAVSDNPAWTAKAMAGAKPFIEMFPKAAATIKRGRGPNKAPTKTLVSLRLSPDVIEHFKKKGPGWQVRIDDALRKAAGKR